MTIDATTTDTDMTPAQMNRTLERIYERSEDLWTDWIKLGRAIVERLDLAIRKAGNKRSGKVYSEQLKKAMGAFHENYQKLAGRGVISALESCIANYDDVEAFRTRAEVGDRLTSPKRVWEAFQESLRPSEAKAADPTTGTGDEEDEEFQPHDDGHGKARGRRPIKMLDELDDRISQLLRDLRDMDDVVDPEEHAKRLYGKLIAAGFDSDPNAIADKLEAYARMLLALVEDLRRHGRLPRVLDMRAAL